MKTFFTTLLLFPALALIFGFVFRDQIGNRLGMGAVAEKPVIYLYPEEGTDVDVSLSLAGEMTCTYPAYGNGWHVTASPDGTLIDEDGKAYYALYREGELKTEYDLTKGYCVAGSDTAAFLEEALNVRGLTAREANELIIYWLPQMQENEHD